jgi:predicted unusual protein kinase regulating ubiquinone biosynthesis (AarF/ABC1/UbiB family)/nucleotide-binding universal stress UspA family protein
LAYHVETSGSASTDGAERIAGASAQTPRRVMVATDRSETAERAVRWGARFAERFGADLHLVRVVRPDSQWSAPDRAADETRDLADYARSIAGERGYGRVLVSEDPALALAHAAETDAIDVLVVGNAGMAGRKEFLLGNVPNRITHNARCTVVIVNTVGTDGDGPPRVVEPTTSSRSPQSRVLRGGTIAAVLAKHGLRELFDVADEDGSTGRRRQARRLRAALEELGPTFAKIGQLLSLRPDLLPPEYVEELASLRDRVAPLTEEQVVRVMEEELGVPWEDVFATIEREPLAAGSIAQVHRASLAGGNKVVVKVQRPDARELITQDLALLETLAGPVGRQPRVRRFIDVRALVEHLSATLQRELDFRLEAKNAERMHQALADFGRLAVPPVHADISTSRFLVMHDVSGVPVADVPDGPLRIDTARQLVESYCKQILIDGFFHADPHPGNLMWAPDEQRLFLLDLGSVGEVDADLREHMILVLTAFWQDDADAVCDAILMLSNPHDGRTPDEQGFRRDISALMARQRATKVKNVQLAPLLQEIVEAAFRHGVTLPSSLMLTAKALGQMQVVAAQLDPALDMFDVAGRFLLRWFVRRMIARADPKRLVFESQKLKVRSLRLLESLERLVGARPGHTTDFRFRAVSLEETLACASRRLALGMSAGFSVLATALVAVAERGPSWTLPVLTVLSAVLLILLAVNLLRGNDGAGPSGGH